MLERTSEDEAVGVWIFTTDVRLYEVTTYEW